MFRGIVAGVALLIGLSGAASATTYTFTSCGFTCNQTPIGTVTTSLSSGVTTVDIKLLSDYYFYQAGTAPMIGFNVGSDTLTNFTYPTVLNGSTSTWEYLTFASPGTQLDGQGKFTNGFGLTPNTNILQGQELVFSFQGVSSLTDFVSNASGLFFAVDVCEAPTNGNTGCGTGATGWIGASLGGGGNEGSTPLPSALAMFVPGVAGLIAMARRRRKTQQAA